MEVLAFSEWMVAGQDELAVDMAWLSGGVDSRSQARVVGSEGELVSGEVAAEVEFGEDDEFGALGDRLGDEFPAAVKVRL
jgi:hypothetical protein